MAANCAQLRQSLAHLQSQLNVLTNKKEESPKPEKQKKSKSKKNKSDKQKANQEVEKSEDGNTKDSSEENQPSVEEVKPNEEDSPEEKVDNKTMETLIQAINMANINLCDLEIVNEKQNETVELDQAVLVEEIIESVDAKLEQDNKIEDVNDSEVILDKTVLKEDSKVESVESVDSNVESKCNLATNESNKGVAS